MTLESIIFAVFGILTGIFVYSADSTQKEDKLARISTALMVAAWWPLFWFLVALIQFGKAIVNLFTSSKDKEI